MKSAFVCMSILHSKNSYTVQVVFIQLFLYSSLIPYLKSYLRNPYARLENNTAERAIRPLVIGRKNWLFFGSLKGAKAGCILLSLVQTCRNLGINPQSYLEDIFRRIQDQVYNKLGDLLPDNWLKTKGSSSISI